MPRGKKISAEQILAKATRDFPLIAWVGRFLTALGRSG